MLGVGSSATLTVKLKKGVRYSYWCGVSDHAARACAEASSRARCSRAAFAGLGRTLGKCSSEDGRSSSSRTRNRSPPRSSKPSAARASTRRVRHRRARRWRCAERVEPDLVLLDVMLPDGVGLRGLPRAARRGPRVSDHHAHRARRARPTAWSGSSSAPTTTWSSRSARARWSRASRAVLAARRRPASAAGRRRDRDRRACASIPARAERRRSEGDELELSRKEFDLLRLLMRERRLGRHPRAADRRGLGHELVRLDEDARRPRRAACGRSWATTPATPRYIHTVRGVGFRFSSRPKRSEPCPSGPALAAFAYVLILVIVALEVPLILNVVAAGGRRGRRRRRRPRRSSSQPARRESGTTEPR